MELALARKVIDEAINHPADHTFAMNAVLHVIRDQELRMQDLEATMKPSKGGELEDRIEVAAEEILMVCERHGLGIVSASFGMTDKTEISHLLVERVFSIARMRLLDPASTRSVDDLLEGSKNFLEQ